MCARLRSLQLTSIGVIEVNKLLPLVVGEQAEHSAPQGRPHLDDKLHLVIGGVTGRDKGGVQSAAEGGQGVHGLLVVESEDGVHPTGELGANCRDGKVQEDMRQHVLTFVSLSYITSGCNRSLCGKHTTDHLHVDALCVLDTSETTNGKNVNK